MSNMQTVIVVAERIDTHNSNSSDEWTLEYLEDSYFEDLVTGLEEAGYNWEHLDSPEDLVARLGIGRDVLVIPLWSGRESRNRRALIPAICESFGVRYIGADVYAAMICQDKVLAKTFCSRAGLATPKHVLIPEHREPADFAPVRFPCVVKPSLEGGSMGISDKSIVHDESEALKQAYALRNIWKQPILVEEFVTGREVSICLAGNSSNYVIGAAEVVVSGEPSYFDSKVNGVELKKYINIDRTNVKCRQEEIEPFLPACLELFRSLKKVDFIRIDGKLSPEGFTVLELTPDAHLGASSSLAVSLTNSEFLYPDLLRLIIDSVE